MKIKATVANRKVLREHAKEAMANYSHVITWIVLDANGDLCQITEPQGQNYYNGKDEVIATTGSLRKACGEGAVTNEYGEEYKTQKSYLIFLLGKSEYERIFLSR